MYYYEFLQFVNFTFSYISRRVKIIQILNDLCD